MKSDDYCNQGYYLEDSISYGGSRKVPRLRHLPDFLEIRKNYKTGRCLIRAKNYTRTDREQELFCYHFPDYETAKDYFRPLVKKFNAEEDLAQAEWLRFIGEDGFLTKEGLSVYLETLRAEGEYYPEEWCCFTSEEYIFKHFAHNPHLSPKRRKDAREALKHGPNSYLFHDEETGELRPVGDYEKLARDIAERKRLRREAAKRNEGGNNG